MTHLPAKVAIALGRWGAPPEPFAWAVLAFAGACLLGALSGRFDPLDGMTKPSRARFLAGTSLAAAFLTIAYVAHYLRGGPRIIDATTYWLQAKALSRGHIAWHVPFPSSSFRGRFLLFQPPDQLAGIFPPGWPLLLACGFVLGAPLIVGIALSAALTLATYGLAREALHDRDEASREHASRVAVLLSLACATLRYHTADPMSHAASALGITIALTYALRAARTDRAARDLLIAGLCVGFVAATRPVSALPIAAIALFSTRRTPWASRARFFVGLVPGIALLLWAQRAATGSFLESTQRAYYAVSDGPPGCFHYGFGKGIGCLYEHGDFVRARLAGGYGLLAALGTTARRLHMHLSDALDAWPVSLLAIAPCARLARQPWARVAIALVALQILVYAPFYFDGDYPGGGARFFADVLPIEHVLVAIAVILGSTPGARSAVAPWRKASALVGLVLAGFALHGSFDHLALAERDGGKPMFEPERLQEEHIEAGLLFMDTDHGFDLAYDPAVTDPLRGLVVARLHNDSHDRLLYDSLGRPPTWVYRFGQGNPTVLPFSPSAATDGAGRERWRFEAEAEWPPLSQDGAWAEPVWVSGSCASGGQVLTVHPAPAGHVTLAVPIPREGRFSVQPHVFSRVGGGPITMTLRQAAASLHWNATPMEGCTTLVDQEGDLQKGEATLELASGTEASLDWVEVRPAVGH